MEATFWGLHLASKKNRPSIAIGICKLNNQSAFSVESKLALLAAGMAAVVGVSSSRML